MDQTDDGRAADGCPDGAVSRRAARAHRQARVGILPNPNRAPAPPARRPPLIGRWVALRSSRRPPPPAAAPEPPQPVPEPDAPTVRTDPSGAILQIDIRRLDAVADALTPARTVRRAGFADRVLGAPAPAGAETAPLPDPADPPDTGAATGATDPAPDPPPPSLRTRLGRWLRGG